MLTKLRLYLADLSLATIEQQLQSLESDYYQRKIERNRLYARHVFESRQPMVSLSRDSIVIIATVLMALAGIFATGL